MKAKVEVVEGIMEAEKLKKGEKEMKKIIGSASANEANENVWLCNRKVELFSDFMELIDLCQSGQIEKAMGQFNADEVEKAYLFQQMAEAMFGKEA